jgi:hypothetical protein
MILLHMGALHPYEKVATLILAFAPFVVLGVVIAVRRRQDAQEHAVDDPVAQRDR